MSPAVSSLLLTAEVWVQSVASPYTIIAGESFTGKGFPPSHLAFLLSWHHPNSVV